MRPALLEDGGCEPGGGGPWSVVGVEWKRRAETAGVRRGLRRRRDGERAERRAGGMVGGCGGLVLRVDEVFDT